MRYLLTSLLSCIGHYALCCTCILNANVKDEIDARDVVFVGKVLSNSVVDGITNKTVNLPLNFNVRQYNDTTIDIYKLKDEYRVLVTALYKGKIKSDTISIYTDYHGFNGACGFKFNIGESYIIYAYYSKVDSEKITKHKKMCVNICSRTRSASDINEIKEIEKNLRNKKKK